MSNAKLPVSRIVSEALNEFLGEIQIFLIRLVRILALKSQVQVSVHRTGLIEDSLRQPVTVVPLNLFLSRTVLGVGEEQPIPNSCVE